MDAVVHRYHEAPKQYLVCEMKTHNAKSYKELTEKRVQAAKPMHYAQTQAYMGLSGMTRALYFAVNKDTDDIYTEYVHFDEEAFSRLVSRAERVITANEPPLRISQDPAWFQCKMCDMAPICHGTEAPEVNCRTCAHSTPNTKLGTWDCQAHEKHLSVSDQRDGCDQHRYIPILLETFAEMTDASEKDNWVKYKNRLTGNEFYNGDLSSDDIYNCADKRALGDPSVNSLRYELDGKLVA